MKTENTYWFITSLIVIATLLLTVSCDEKEDINDEINTTQNVPVLITTNVSEITQTTALSGGNITDEGSSTITARGVCWSKNQDPSVDDSTTGDGAGFGVFTCSISGLTPGATYFVRAFATNGAGTAYGNQVNFETLSEATPSYTLTLQINPQKAGLVSGAGDYEENEKVIITATPDTGYMFINWTQGDTEVSNEANFNYIMPAENVTLTANFEEESCGDNCVIDIDGNEYPTVIIGSQEWMAKNLRVTRYSNGDSIPTNLSEGEWNGADYGAYYIHPYSTVDGIDSEEEMLSAYGALYNWFTVVDERNLCPTGWHVSKNEEWTELTDYLKANGYNGTEGTALKSTSGWNNSGNGTDVYGFSAVPGGAHFTISKNHYVGEFAYWWCASEDGLSGWYRSMSCNDNKVENYSNNKRVGYSVRCVRD